MSSDDEMYAFEDQINIRDEFMSDIDIMEKSMGTMGQSRMGTTKEFRPVTATRAAGFTSRGRTSANKIKISLVPDMKKSNSDQLDKANILEQIKKLESKMLKLVNQSCVYKYQKTHQLALEIALEAFQLEKQASKLRNKLVASMGSVDPDTSLPSVNLDVVFGVNMNLALRYHDCNMWNDELQVYNNLLKNKVFTQAEKLRVNMGNTYMEMKDYGNALKMYRMALDKLPATNRIMRLKLMKNIGLASIKLGNFPDAISAYEAVLETSPDHHAAFNLMLCYHASGDDKKMQLTFSTMAKIDITCLDQSSDQSQLKLRKNVRSKIHQETLPQSHSVDALLPNCPDKLQDLAKEKQKQVDRYLSLAAKLTAKMIESEEFSGFDWIISRIKEGPYAYLAPEIEIAKAIGYLKTKSFSKAIETLKSFETRDISMVGTASTNLSFLYLLEQDYDNAIKYSEVAIEMDRFNSRAFTNQGNCFYYKKDYEKAAKCYTEAINADGMATEALYNLGLVHKLNKEYPEALECFEKLFTLVQDSPDIIYQVASIHEAENRTDKALEWFNILISVVPTDPTILAKLGDIYLQLGDKSQAFHYYSESYRYYPANVTVMVWLGAYYIDCDMYEQALVYFKHACLLDQNKTNKKRQVKWMLAVATCYRKMGLLMHAMEILKESLDKFPSSVECLKMLISTGSDMELNNLSEYKMKLEKLEQSNKASIDYNKREEITTVKPVQQSNNVTESQQVVQELMNWNEDLDTLL